MRVGIRLGALIAVFVALAIGTVAGQGAATATVDPVLKQRVERRFDVLPVQGARDPGRPALLDERELLCKIDRVHFPSST